MRSYIFTCTVLTLVLQLLAGCGSPKADSPDKASSSKQGAVGPIRKHISDLTIDKSPSGTVFLKFKKVSPGAIDLESIKPVIQIRSGSKKIQTISVTKKELLAGFTRKVELPRGGEYSVVLEAEDKATGSVTHYSRQYFVEVDKAKVAEKSQLIKGLDIARMQIPKGLGRFCAKNNNGAVFSSDKNPEAIAQTAQEYEAMDQNLGNWASELAEIKHHCAVRLAREGKTNKAMAILKDVRKRGFFPAKWLDSKGLEAMKKSDEFQELSKFAKSTNVGEAQLRLHMVDKPYFHLRDVLALKTEPPLPSADQFAGKALVVFMGQTIEDTKKRRMTQTEWVAKSLAETEVPTIAILNQKPKKNFPKIKVYITKTPVRLDGVDVVWYANKKGEVVHVNRTDIFSSTLISKALAEYLNSTD